MNILIYDVGNKEITLQAEVLHDGVGDNFEFASSYNDAIELYTTKKYDVIIVDFTIDDGNKFLEQVVSLNPKQATITLAYQHEYSVIEGCDYCMIHYNRRRLIKPTSSAKILFALDTFHSPYVEQTCENHHQFDAELK